MPAVIPDLKKRGSGNTTKQLKDAPRDAIYIAVNNVNVRYTKNLAQHLGRQDLEIVDPEWLSRRRWHGRRFTGVVIDHATALTGEQGAILLEVLERVHAAA